MTLFMPSRYSVFVIIFVFSLFFEQYLTGIPGIRLAELLMCTMTPLVIMCSDGNRFKINLNFLKYPILNKLYLLCAVFYTLSLLSFCLEPANISVIQLSRAVRYFCYIIFLGIALYCVYEKNVNVLNLYRKSSLALAIYIIAQFCCWKFWHIELPVNILPLFSFERELLHAYTPQGIFVEPAYAAVFLLPSLCFTIYNCTKCKTYVKEYFVIAISILLTSSFQGVVLVIFLTGILLKKILFSFKRNKQTLFFIMVCIILGIFIIGTFRDDALAKYKYRMDILLGNSFVPGSSVALRVYRGYAVFNELPFVNKVIGVGVGNIGEFVMAHNIKTIYDAQTINELTVAYVNGFSSILISYGILGCGLYIAWFLMLFYKIKGAYRLCALLLFILSFGGDGSLLSLFGSFYVFFSLLGICTQGRKNQ